MKISLGGISVGAGASVIFLFSLKRWFMRRFCNIGIFFITRKACPDVKLTALHGNLYWSFHNVKRKKKVICSCAILFLRSWQGV